MRMRSITSLPSHSDTVITRTLLILLYNHVPVRHFVYSISFLDLQLVQARLNGVSLRHGLDSPHLEGV